MHDVRIMELLASRICHDLISPVGAINNGLELLEEMGNQVGEEAVKLIGHSAEQASRRLRLFRLSYGAAGADSNLTADDVLLTLRDYLQGSRVNLQWDNAAFRAQTVVRGIPKVLLNCAIIAVEALVHGGTITLTGFDDAARFEIQAEGRAAGQRDEAWAPLRQEVDVPDLTAKSIHPYLTACFAKEYGVDITWQQPQEDLLVMALKYTRP